MTRPLVIACAALTADLRSVLGASAFDQHLEIAYLPAQLHNHPERIVPAIETLLRPANEAGRPVFVAYADCGTGGQLDALLAQFPTVQRLSGAHCYQFFAGDTRFAELHEQELGSFYLTDFLAKHFDALVWSGLGLDRSPQLRDTYFGNYTRVVLLSQVDDVAVIDAARAAAVRLGLAFVHHHVGRDGLAAPLQQWSVSVRKLVA